jgi:hypothetical protein
MQGTCSRWQWSNVREWWHLQRCGNSQLCAGNTGDSVLQGRDLYAFAVSALRMGGWLCTATVLFLLAG